MTGTACRTATLLGAALLCAAIAGCESGQKTPLAQPTQTSPVSVASVPDKPPSAPEKEITPKPAEKPLEKPAPSQPPANPAPQTSTPAAKPPATSNSSPAPGKNAPPADNEVKLLVKEKTFKQEGNALRVSYDDIDLIKVLNLKKPSPNVLDLLPGWIKGLEGKRVRMRGFMYPPYQQEGIDHFVFCRDTGACCFGPNPVVYYMIDVRMKPGSTTDYIENRPFDVEGTFRIKTAILEGTGEVYELYHLDQAAVIRK